MDIDMIHMIGQFGQIIQRIAVINTDIKQQRNNWNQGQNLPEPSAFLNFPIADR